MTRFQATVLIIDILYIYRDNYDKEVKSVQSTTSTRAVVNSHLEPRQRSRKPDMPTYAAPTQRKDPSG